jgi:anti-anti-sigma factor
VAAITVSTEERAGALVLHVRGRLQLDHVEPLRSKLQLAWRSRPPRLILEFSGCPFVDSAGIAAVVAAYKRAREANMGFFLVGVGEQFQNALQLTRLSEVFDIRDSVEAALVG